MFSLLNEHLFLQDIHIYLYYGLTMLMKEIMEGLSFQMDIL